VLSHGLTDSDALWAWYDQTGARGESSARNGTSSCCSDNGGAPAMWWDFQQALPVKWTGPLFDAAQDGQVAVESLELVHRGAHAGRWRAGCWRRRAKVAPGGSDGTVATHA